MKTTPHTILLALGLSALVASAADSAADREKTLRFPGSGVKSNSYNAAPDADYRHASAAAYEAFRAMKFGVRIHWGLYSLLPAARESWTFLSLRDAERQKYLESSKQWNPQDFNAEEWMKFFERAHRIARHRTQLRELLTNYGKIDMVCLDIALGEEDWPGVKTTMKQLRQLQPDVMFRNRGVGNYGDYYTPERVVPGDNSGNSMPWMGIYPLGTNFSWEGDAAKHKGAKWVVDNLVDSVAKGGNFMVGIGPDGSGRFHPTAIGQPEEVGAWLKVNGEGIFNTHARPGDGWKDGDAVRLTESGDGRFVYAFVRQRPTGPVALRSVRAPVGAKVVLLGSGQPLSWRSASEGMTIDFPPSAKPTLACTLKIETTRSP